MDSCTHQKWSHLHAQAVQSRARLVPSLWITNGTSGNRVLFVRSICLKICWHSPVVCEYSLAFCFCSVFQVSKVWKRKGKEPQFIYFWKGINVFGSSSSEPVLLTKSIHKLLQFCVGGNCSSFGFFSFRRAVFFVSTWTNKKNDAGWFKVLFWFSGLVCTRQTDHIHGSSFFFINTLCWPQEVTEFA